MYSAESIRQSLKEQRRRGHLSRKQERVILEQLRRYEERHGTVQRFNISLEELRLHVFCGQPAALSRFMNSAAPKGTPALQRHPAVAR